MRISEYKSLLKRALPRGRRILAVGPPGLGKTFCKVEVCRELGWDYIPLSAPLQSPVKVGGYPKASPNPDGDATHQLFNGIAKAFRATKPTVLDWDDLGMGNGETLKAILDLIQFGRIDDKQLPECVVLSGSSNDVGHGADVQGLIEPLKSRWHSIIHIAPNIDDLVVYGLVKGWPGWLLAWVRNNPDCLDNWKPTKNLQIDSCTARGIEYAAEWDLMGEDSSEVFAGCVGKGAATLMVAFKGLINELPDVDQVLMMPDKAPVPENPSARYLISMALACKMTAGNFERALVYLQRLPQMFRAFAIRDAFHAEQAKREAKTLAQGHTPISSSRGFTAWACSAEGKEVLAATQ